VLSEMPDEWLKKLRTWIKINQGKKRRVRGLAVPDRNDEYFLYQTLMGAFPFADADYPAFVRRMKAYIVKAVREAKIHTAWSKPDTEYEDAYVSFADRPCAREAPPMPRATTAIWRQASLLVEGLCLQTPSFHAIALG
jgi:(1->4)-alpha-D-glucan 1-alpha-D-glucosylmutase